MSRGGPSGASARPPPRPSASAASSSASPGRCGALTTIGAARDELRHRAPSSSCSVDEICLRQRDDAAVDAEETENLHVL